MDDEGTLRSDIRSIGVRRALFGIEFYLSLAMAIIAGIIIFSFPLQSETVISVICAFITASGALLGLSVAAFSIVLSLSGSKDMMTVFFKGQSFKMAKIDFSMISIISGICITVSLFTIIISGALTTEWISLALCISMFFFLWEVLNMIVLITNTIRHLSDFKAFCHLYDEEDSE